MPLRAEIAWSVDPRACGLLAAAVGALTVTCVGPMAGPAVCGADAPCDDGQACVVGRCRHPTEIPAASLGRLSRLEPTAVALVAPAEAAGGPLPELLELGAERLAGAVLLLRFPLRPDEAAALRMAVLELTPAPNCAGPPTTIDVRVQQVRGPWQPDTVSAVRMPELGLPEHAARYTSSTPRPLRIDITEIVRQWATHPHRYHGLGLAAERLGPAGSACFGSGSGAAPGPTLALYLHPAVDGGTRDGGSGGGGSRDEAADAGEGGFGQTVEGDESRSED